VCDTALTFLSVVSTAWGLAPGAHLQYAFSEPCSKKYCRYRLQRHLWGLLPVDPPCGGVHAQAQLEGSCLCTTGSTACVCADNLSLEPPCRSLRVRACVYVCLICVWLCDLLTAAVWFNYSGCVALAGVLVGAGCTASTIHVCLALSPCACVHKPVACADLTMHV
jgi:hypothetical protein